MQDLCDNWNEQSSTVIESDHREQDIFHRPADEKEKLNVELPRHRGQAHGNVILLSYWFKKKLKFKTDNYTISCSGAISCA